MIDKPFCPHCPAAEETLEHVLLLCPRYDIARTTFFTSLGFGPPARPPDALVMDTCLGCTPDRLERGRQPTAHERSSGTFLLKIEELRPKLGMR